LLFLLALLSGIFCRVSFSSLVSPQGSRQFFCLPSPELRKPPSTSSRLFSPASVPPSHELFVFFPFLVFFSSRSFFFPFPLPFPLGLSSVAAVLSALPPPTFCSIPASRCLLSPALSQRSLMRKILTSSSSFWFQEGAGRSLDFLFPLSLFPSHPAIFLRLAPPFPYQRIQSSAFPVNQRQREFFLQRFSFF